MMASFDKLSPAARTTRFWWIRHAPVDHGGRIYGQTDVSCDCSDQDLFRALAARLPREAVWATSSLRRTHETASAIVRAGGSGLAGPEPIPGPGAQEVPELAEQNFGAWQGLSYEELREKRAGEFHRFWHAPAQEVPPGGESFVVLVARVSRAIARLAEAHAGRDIIAVVHGGTIRAALSLALGIEPEAALAFAIDNCSLTRIDRVTGAGLGHGWQVLTVNRPPR